MPRCASVRATTKPSPPLLPRPHSTPTLLDARSSNAASIAATACRPAFSISTIEGIPTSLIVWRSASRICCVFSTLIVTLQYVRIGGPRSALPRERQRIDGKGPARGEDTGDDHHQAKQQRT